MKIHNILEEIVRTSVDEYFDSLDEGKKDGCSEQCRLDVTCYVLNNMLPKYVVSTRGIIHHELDYSKKIQLKADVLSLVKKGYSIVSNRKRPYINTNTCKTEEDEEKFPYFYNFPNIIGKVINGTTFEPVSDAEVTLIIDDAPVFMASYLMENPIKLSKHTGGMFTFWPSPQRADKLDKEKSFMYKITVNHPDFNEYIKLIEITATSEENFLDSIQFQNRKTLEDIFIFPKGV
ncbi:MAG: late competence development ComFB family protein [Spirochaetes bacterium]|nr:late competence development ComFB family protein [Spirochaetota bacterium]